jgi:cbb3-type cytochrome oxidase maturation protein
MKIIFLLIAISLLLAAGFLAAFFWAVKGGQYEDEYTPSVRILLDDPAYMQSLNSKANRTASPKPSPEKAK